FTFHISHAHKSMNQCSISIDEGSVIATLRFRASTSPESCIYTQQDRRASAGAGRVQGRGVGFSRFPWLTGDEGESQMQPPDPALFQYPLPPGDLPDGKSVEGPERN